MAGRRAAPEIALSDEERSELESLSRRRKTAQAMAMRARIVLACAEGLQSKQVAVSIARFCRHTNPDMMRRTSGSGH
jgi:hypothetical protein